MFERTYVEGASLPDIALELYDRGELVDTGGDFAFEVRVGRPGQAAEFVKTDHVYGADTSPNVVVVWDDTDELASLDRGTYKCDVHVRNITSSQAYILRGTLKVEAAVLAP